MKLKIIKNLFLKNMLSGWSISGISGRVGIVLGVMVEEIIFQDFPKRTAIFFGKVDF
jgi:hypothetical protein